VKLLYGIPITLSNDGFETEFTWIIIIFFIIFVILFFRLIYRWYNVYNKSHKLTKPTDPEIKIKKIPSPKFKLMVGGTYLVLEHTDEEVGDGFRIFKDVLRDGTSGFVITRTLPNKIEKKYNLSEVPIIWLSRSKKKNTITPTNLGNIVDEIKEFITKNQNAIVMFDGLEYLIVHNDFDRVLKFLHSLRDEIAVQNARLIISLNPGTMTEDKVALLGKELKLLSEHQHKRKN
jgi:hypothetical protein